MDTVKIKQFNYGDQLVPDIELTIDKEQRKKLEIFDGASSIFEQEIVPEREPLALLRYDTPEYQLNSNQGDLKEIISDLDLERVN